MFALWNSIIPTSVDLIIPIIFIARCTVIIQITVVTSMSAGVDTMTVIGTSAISFLTNVAVPGSISVCATRVVLIAFDHGVIPSHSSIFAGVWDISSCAAEFVISRVGSIASITEDFSIGSNASPSALVNSNFIAPFAVCGEVVVFFTMDTVAVPLSVRFAVVDWNSSFAVSPVCGYSVPAESAFVSVVHVGDAVYAVVFPAF